MTENLHEKYMCEALIEARKAMERNEVPIGAVIVANEKIIGRGHNLTETLQDVTAHAEMQAITAAENFFDAKYLTDCILYVTIEPCVMCAGAIGWAQIPHLVFGAMDEKRGFMRFAPNSLHAKTKITKGILENECRNLMLEFFKKKRK
ncbi:MAG: nucleoside deaminase [Paludibacter sp.]|nr:nucleoside deaminase [Paludibacter sp.]